MNIYETLINDDAVNAYVCDRVYPLRARQNAKLPYITYQRISTEPHNSLGTCYDETPTYQIDVWSQTYDEANFIGVAIREPLQSGGGVKVSDNEAFDNDPDIYRVSQDWRIWNED